MPRLVQSLTLAFAVTIALAGCGGTAFDSSHSSTPTTVSAQAKAAAAKAEKPYVDAMVTSAIAEGGGKPGTTSVATIRCIAGAIVHGFGVVAFTANGITPNALRKPNSNLDDLPDPNEVQVAAVGGALQRCKIGQTVAVSLAAALHVTNTTAIRCLANQFATAAGARRFLVLPALERHIDLEAAHNAVGILSACVDLAGLVMAEVNVPLDQTTRTCFTNALHGSDAQLRDFLALKMSGADPDTAAQSSEAIRVALNQCRPSAHTGFTIPND